MKLTELSHDQLLQVKQRYYDDRHPEGVSYMELATVDDLVTDQEVFDEYSGTEFTADDFVG